MSYLIVIDSCGELTDDMKASGHFVSAPLTLDVDQYHFVDDETFDQQEFLKRVKESPNCPKSACPSPEYYRKYFEQDYDHIYAITLSAALSGSYNSAEVARGMVQEEHPDKKIHVFNSRSASIGQTLIGMKITECEEAGMAFEEIVETVEKYIDSQVTYFVLDSLESLRKNGRLSRVKSIMANVLRIKPVMQSTPDGAICQIDQARGIARALERMVEHIVEKTPDSQSRILALSHCNCPERAGKLRDTLAERLKPLRVVLLDTAGVSSLYACDGGIIVVI